MQNPELRTFSIIINSNELKKKLEHLLYDYYNFENILLNIISKNYHLYKKGKDVNDFHLLTSPQLIINILYYYNYQQSEQQEYIKNKYKENQLWQELKSIATKLNPHNLIYIIERVKTVFDIYFTNLELYNQNPSLFTEIPQLPKLKKLSKLTDYSIEIDKYCSVSFVRLESENLVGINLSDHMVYISIDKYQASKLKEINRLYSVRVVYYDDGDLYLQITHLKELNKTKKDKIEYEAENKTIKYAGIDIGENNLMAVFIDDKTTPSLLVDGKSFKNCNEMEFLTNKLHKMAEYTVNYLYLHGVTDLFLSKNLIESKDNKELELIKVVNHNIIKKPFAILIKYIDQEAQKLGINDHYVDESFTSKVSCISGDIKIVQNSHSLIDACNGRRGKRSFFDTVINERFNADLNAAVNHIKVGTGKSFEWLKDKLFKLKNPIKIKSDNEFSELLNCLRNNNLNKNECYALYLAHF